MLRVLKLTSVSAAALLQTLRRSPAVTLELAPHPRHWQSSPLRQLEGCCAQALLPGNVALAGVAKSLRPKANEAIQIFGACALKLRPGVSLCDGSPPRICWIPTRPTLRTVDQV